MLMSTTHWLFRLGPAFNLKRLFRPFCSLTHVLSLVKSMNSSVSLAKTTRMSSVFSSPKQLPKIGASDHYSALVAPVIPSSRPSKLTMMRRDTRPSRIRDFGGWITSFVWDDLYALGSCEEKFKYCYQNFHEEVECFRFVLTVFITQISHG